MLTIGCSLEAATSRLEDMVPENAGSATAPNGLPAADVPAPGANEVKPTPSPSPRPEVLPPAIDDFDGIINGNVKTFVNRSEEIGGLVAEQVGGYADKTPPFY